MERVEEWTSLEWANLGLALGGFVLGAVAIGAAAACTATVVCPILVAGGGAAGFGMQGTAAYNEWGMYFRSQKYTSDVRSMTDLGFSTFDAYENVESTKAWAIIETISILPLMGILGRSLYIGGKGAKHQYKYIMKHHHEIGMRKAFLESGRSAATIVAESEIELAKLVLKFTSHTGNLGKIFGGTSLEKVNGILANSYLTEKQAFKYKKQLQKLQKDYRIGRIDEKMLKAKLDDMVEDIASKSQRRNKNIRGYESSTVVNYTRREIDEQTAKTLAEYFGKPKTMVSFMNKYIGKTSDEAADKIIEKYNKAKNGNYVWGTNWIRKAWHENTYNLVNFKDDFVRMHDDLSKLSPDQFEKYLYDNIDVFTNIFHKAPMRLRTDMPYLMIQGGPHLGQRFGPLSIMGESIIIRKIATARSRLIGESVKAEMRGALGLSAAVTVDTMANITKGFVATVEDQITNQAVRKHKRVKLKNKLKEVKRNLMKSLADTLNDIEANKGIWHKVKNVGKNYELGALKKLLDENKIDIYSESGLVDATKLHKLIFSPKNAKEEAFGHELLDMANPKTFFGSLDNAGADDGIEKVAYAVMDETLNDKSLKGIQKYLAMVKVLTTRELGKVEVY